MDWRIGLAVTPKMRDHYWHRTIFIIRRVTNKGMILLVETYNVDMIRGSIKFKVPADDWMTA